MSALRILVTGHRGFIGKRVVDLVQSRGHHLQLWDESVERLSSHKDDTDVVIHLAAISQSKVFSADRQTGFAVNVEGTRSALEYCCNVNARLVFASSSAVYQSPDDGRALNETAKIGPVSDYGESKRLAEQVCGQVAVEQGVPVTILRLFNVYGPGQAAEFLISYIVEAIRNDRPLSLRMPEAIRDFIYVDDVAKVFVRAAELAHSAEQLRVFNIGSGKATKVHELVEIAAKILGKDVQIERNPSRITEAQAITADITRVVAELGWEPEVDLQSGLRMVSRYFNGENADQS